jgi:hypothetical protein
LRNELVAGQLQCIVSHELRAAIERVVRQSPASKDMSTEEDIVSSRYLATTSEQTEGFICAVVVVISRVCKSVRLLKLFVVMSYEPKNPIIDPNPVSSHLIRDIMKAQVT